MLSLNFVIKLTYYLIITINKQKLIKVNSIFYQLKLYQTPGSLRW